MAISPNHFFIGWVKYSIILIKFPLFYYYFYHQYSCHWYYLLACVLLSTPGVVDGLRGIYYFLFAHFFGVVDGLRGIRLFLFAHSFLQVVNSINAVIIIVYNSIMTVGIVISINIWCTTPSLEVVMIVLLNIS